MLKGTIGIVLTALALPLSAADAGPNLKVAAVQFRSSFDVKKNCERIGAHLQRLAAAGVQVAAFPECALTGYDTGAEFAPSSVEVEAAEKQLAQACRTSKIAAVIGSVYKVNGHVYDTSRIQFARGVGRTLRQGLPCRREVGHTGESHRLLRTGRSFVERDDLP